MIPLLRIMVPVKLFAYLLGRTRQTDMNGLIKCSLLTINREEYLETSNYACNLYVLTWCLTFGEEHKLQVFDRKC
jgi:hypothetical protein